MSLADLKQLPVLKSGALLKYSVSVATFTALSWHVYQEYQRKSLSGKTWEEVAQEKRRSAAATFCSFLCCFHQNLKEAREFLRTGRVEEAMSVLVRCLQGWQFKKQTLKALKRHLHPHFFAQLVNKLVQERIFPEKYTTDLLSHLAAPNLGNHVGLNISLQSSL